MTAQDQTAKDPKRARQAGHRQVSEGHDSGV
jgi:hypothetical protein